jgi:protein-disulfide isomerase
VLIAFKPFRVALFTLSLAALGCHAQAPSQTSTQTPGTLSPEQARRVEVLIRSKSSVPPEYVVNIGPKAKSEVPGFDEIPVTFQANGQSSKPMNFLLSADGKTLAQFTKFDISADPKKLVSEANRPARGGPSNAPVVIVGFDDLECPFCSKMHSQLFPALTARYKNQVRIVYRDFPLDQHPWAMRAAIDTNCLSTQSGTGYWTLVDYIHAHAAELGGDEKTLAKANATLDSLTLDEGKRQKVDAKVLNACIVKQDNTVVKASMKEAEALGVDSTPALFINGEKLAGAVPIEYVYRMIDEALRAEGQVPPAPVSIPAIKPGS